MHRSRRIFISIKVNRENPIRILYIYLYIYIPRKRVAANAINQFLYSVSAYIPFMRIFLLRLAARV